MSDERRAMSGPWRLFNVLVACAVCANLASCGERTPDAPLHDDLRGYAVPARQPDQTYTVRGRVSAVPVPGNPRTQFSVAHEAIPEFKNRKGDTIGMAHMDMHFPPARGVDVSVLKPGDAIEITFSVFWGETPSYIMTAFKRLDAGATLNFESGASPAPGR